MVKANSDYHTDIGIHSFKTESKHWNSIGLHSTISTEASETSISPKTSDSKFHFKISQELDGEKLQSNAYSSKRLLILKQNVRNKLAFGNDKFRHD